MDHRAIYRVAAGLALIGVVAHELVGAPMVLEPLAGAALPDEVVWLHHFSWHVGSVSVLAMTGMYWYASVRPGNHALAVVATGISAGFALLGITLALFGGRIGWTTPAPYVWLVVGCVGGWGVLRELSNRGKPGV